MSYQNSLVEQALYLLELTDTVTDIHTVYRYECSLFELLNRMSDDERLEYRTRCTASYF